MATLERGTKTPISPSSPLGCPGVRLKIDLIEGSRIWTSKQSWSRCGSHHPHCWAIIVWASGHTARGSHSGQAFLSLGCLHLCRPPYSSITDAVSTASDVCIVFFWGGLLWEAWQFKKQKAASQCSKRTKKDFSQLVFGEYRWFPYFCLENKDLGVVAVTSLVQCWEINSGYIVLQLVKNWIIIAPSSPSL